MASLSQGCWCCSKMVDVTFLIHTLSYPAECLPKTSVKHKSYWWGEKHILTDPFHCLIQFPFNTMDFSSVNFTCHHCMPFYLCKWKILSVSAFWRYSGQRSYRMYMIFFLWWSYSDKFNFLLIQPSQNVKQLRSIIRPFFSSADSSESLQFAKM